jgi:hypothetical protein
MRLFSSFLAGLYGAERHIGFRWDSTQLVVERREAPSHLDRYKGSADRLAKLARQPSEEP